MVPERCLTKVWAQFRPFARVGGPDLPARAVSLARKAGDDQAWAEFEKQSLAQCSQWHGGDLVKVLHACAIAQRRPHHLLAKLAKEIPDKLPQFDVSSLCICLHSFAQLRSKQTALLKVISRRLLHPDIVPDLSAQHLSSLLYSHVRVLYFDAGLTRLASARIASEAWPMEDLATALQAFATFRMEQVRLSTTSARQLAEAAPMLTVPLLGDLLEAMLRLSMPCRTLQLGLAARCSEPAELEGLSVDVLLKLLSCLGDARDAHRAIAEKLFGQVDELDHPRRLVQAIDGLAKARLSEAELLKPLGLKIVYHMVDFSPKDVAKTASACQQLMLNDGAVLEALVRQGLRRAQRLTLPQAEAVVAACRAAEFEHPVLVEFLEGMQHQKKELSREVKESPEADWENIEDEPIFFEPHIGSEDLSEDRTGRRPIVSAGEDGATPASEAIHDSQPWKRERRDAEVQAERTSDLLEDKDIRKIMKQVERKVLRPAGLKSRSLAMTGRRK
ncbi:unnamed protein product [Cladocopium goreaui]|uniref:Ammonium transporter 2 n=1 Tax=Cladocopium goreaui TaxID=2562237 RepID=A0A9P1FF10_9DINO|nr:unnamed protein product [Cladocopium goreaui]